MRIGENCSCVWKHSKRVHICPQCPILVLVESPLAGDVDRNISYARACLLDSLSRGEAPFASHLLYPLVLDDTVPAERTKGIEAGLAWGRAADLTAVYQDLGISKGMRLGIDRAKAQGRRVVYRRIDPPNPSHFQDRDTE